MRAARARHIRRVAAAVGFWAVAVLFVADVSLLSGWLTTDAVAAPSPNPTAVPTDPTEPAEVATPTEAASPQPETVLLDATGTTITFPAPPRSSQSTIEIAGVDTPTEQHLLTGAEGVTYTVGVIEYPVQVDVSDPAVNLLASVSGAAGSAGARVSAQDVTVYQGVPAVEFTLTTGSVDVQARYVLDDHRLYAASVTHTTGDLPDDAQAFLDSLELAG